MYLSVLVPVFLCIRFETGPVYRRIEAARGIGGT